MIPETRKLLLKLLDEYDTSLTRMQGERDLMKCIEDRAIVECGITAKAFKTVATALWRDQARRVQDDLDAQVALFEAVIQPQEGDQ